MGQEIMNSGEVLSFHNKGDETGCETPWLSKDDMHKRQWATRMLRNYILKGYMIDEKRLKGELPFGEEYFNDQRERIQEVRISERRFYQKLADIFEQCSFDYDKTSTTTKAFYSLIWREMQTSATSNATDILRPQAELFIDCAEQMAEDERPMRMADWLTLLERETKTDTKDGEPK